MARFMRMCYRSRPPLLILLALLFAWGQVSGAHAMPAHPPAPQPAAGMDCPQHAHHAEAAPSPPTHPGGSHPQDCCGGASGACHCSAVAALPAAAIALPSLSPPGVRSPPRAYPPPARTDDLFRPPIA